MDEEIDEETFLMGGSVRASAAILEIWALGLGIYLIWRFGPWA